MRLLLLGRRIKQEAKVEKHIQKLLLLGTHENSISHYLNYFASTKIISLLDGISRSWIWFCICSKCGFLNKCNGSCFSLQFSSNQTSVVVKSKFFFVNVLISLNKYWSKSSKFVFQLFSSLKVDVKLGFALQSLLLVFRIYCSL